MRRLGFVVAAVAFASILVGLNLIAGTSAAPLDDSSLRAALLSARMDYQILPSLDAADTTVSITSANALQVAVEMYGEPPRSRVTFGRLTVMDYHVGDETTPLVIKDRVVYAVQLTGLALPPFGGPTTPSNIHTELVAFVDARTGEVLLATTVR